MINRLKSIGEKNNVIIGWCKAEPFEELRDMLKKNPVPFVSYSIDERINPMLTMENAKSIVAVGMSYQKEAAKPCDNIIRGAVSVGAIGLDYHKQIMTVLKDICDKALCGYDNMPFVDTGPLVDRYVAYKCGLGFYGRHGNIINEEKGSMFFIGYIITSAEIKPYMTPSSKKCNDCKRCINACPGDAITENGFYYSRCISYLTQCKDELTEEQKKIMGIQLYGCDVCQKVCPYNKEYEAVSSNDAFPPIEEILSLSNKQFKNRFGNTAAGWRGKKIIQRNALIALENMKTQSAQELLNKFKDKE